LTAEKIKGVKRIRSGNGLGDNLYLLAIVQELIRKGKNLQVCTKYPELFNHLPVETDDFSRSNIDILAHYSKRKEENTNQWEDICIQAGLRPFPFKIDWNPGDSGPKMEVLERAKGRKILIVQGGRIPMARKDGFGMELLPEERLFNLVSRKLTGEYFRVQIGDSKNLFDIEHDFSLNGGTSVPELMDVASIADGFVSQCSFLIPLAEGFGKKGLFLWSQKGLSSDHRYIARITPRKILSSEKSFYVMDGWRDDEIIKVVDEFHQFR